MADPLGVLSLCSGIGGLDLGVGRAIRSRVVGYVERDAYAASVLMARMEDSSLDPAPVWIGDLRELDPAPLRGYADIVVAGFPCPPFSVAGKRLGAGDERDLWPAVRDIIRGVAPRYVFLENVGGAVRHPDGLGRWLGDAAELGFDAEFATVRAADVGASHLRERLFILATSRDMADAEGGEPGESSTGDRGGRSYPRRRGIRGGEEALAERSGAGLQGIEQDRRMADAILLPQVPPPGGADGAGGEVAASAGGGLDLDEWPPGPDGDWSGIPEHLHPATESGLRRVAHGLPDLVDAAQIYRAEQLRALGNGVVPAQAEFAFRLLWERAHQEPSTPTR